MYRVHCLEDVASYYIRNISCALNRLSTYTKIVCSCSKSSFYNVQKQYLCKNIYHFFPQESFVLSCCHLNIDKHISFSLLCNFINIVQNAIKFQNIKGLLTKNDAENVQNVMVNLEDPIQYLFKSITYFESHNIQTFDDS